MKADTYRDQNMKPVYHLKDWTIENIPGTVNYWLIGTRYVDMFPNGVKPNIHNFIHTSELLKIEFGATPGEHQVKAETKNSIYILDPIDKLYTATYLKNMLVILNSGPQETNIIDDKEEEDESKNN